MRIEGVSPNPEVENDPVIMRLHQEAEADGYWSRERLACIFHRVRAIWKEDEPRKG